MSKLICPNAKKCNSSGGGKCHHMEPHYRTPLACNIKCPNHDGDKDCECIPAVRENIPMTDTTPAGTAMSRDERLEKVAKALATVDFSDRWWGQAAGDWKKQYRIRAQAALSAIDEGWTDVPPQVASMYIRAWKVVGYWQYSVELMTDGVFEMEGNGHKYTADEIFEGCQWFGPITPPTTQEGK